MKITREITEIWLEANRCESKNEFLRICINDNLESDDISGMVQVLERTWQLAHMTMREVVAMEKVSQKDFALLVGASKRTVEDWCRGIINPPIYARLWLHIVLGHFGSDSTMRENSDEVHDGVG